MNISGNLSMQTSMYTLKEANNMSKAQMEQIISAGTQIQQAPVNQKMVNQVNQATANAHINIVV